MLVRLILEEEVGGILCVRFSPSPGASKPGSEVEFCCMDGMKRAPEAEWRSGSGLPIAAAVALLTVD